MGSVKDQYFLQCACNSQRGDRERYMKEKISPIAAYRIEMVIVLHLSVANTFWEMIQQDDTWETAMTMRENLLQRKSEENDGFTNRCNKKNVLFAYVNSCIDFLPLLSVSDSETTTTGLWLKRGNTCLRTTTILCIVSSHKKYLWHI